MKKKLAKFTLGRETLAHLNSQELWPAGVANYTNPSFMKPTCGTCDHVTCTSNVC
jgi:hypothetical protein